MIAFPDVIKENLAIIEGRPWLFYWADLYSYPLLSQSEKEAKLDDAEEFFRSVQKDGLHGYMWMVDRQTDWHRELGELIEKAPKKNREFVAKQVHIWLDEMYRRNVQPDYDFVFAFELSDGRSERFVGSVFKRVMGEIESFFGLQKPAELTADEIRTLSQAFRQRLKGDIRLDPMTETEIADFYRYHNHRGLPMRPLPEKLVNAWPWEKRDYTWLEENDVHRHKKHLELEGEDRSRLVSFITVAMLPDEIDLPGFEVFLGLQGLGFPVQGLVRWKQVDNSTARKKADRKRKGAKDVVHHVGEIGDPSLMESESYDDSQLQVYELQKTRAPVNECYIVISVSADDHEELKQRVDGVISYLDSCGIHAVCPSHEQLSLYDSWMPKAEWEGVGYKQILIPNRTAGIAMPGATIQVGDPDGPPLAFDQRGGLVRINCTRGPQEDSNGSLAIAGPLGSGKSHILKTLLHYALAYYNARALLVDPKGECLHWPGQVPGVGHMVQTLILDGRKNPGSLDPFKVIKDDPEYAAEIAVSVIDQIQRLNSIQEDALFEAAEKTIATGRNSMAGMLDIMETIPHAKELAMRLKRLGRFPLGKLLFAEGEGLTLPDSGAIILGLADLDLPSGDMEPEGYRQKMSMAVMTMTAVLAEQFILRGKKGIYSVAALDEAKRWLKTSKGAALFDRLIRAGRSENAGVWISTQNPSDIPEEMTNLLGMYFCLGTESESETTYALKTLGLDPENQVLREELKKLGRSQVQKRKRKGLPDERKQSFAYFKDLEGRVGLIEVVTPDPELRAFFNTRPKLEYTEDDMDDREIARMDERLDEMALR